jgi:hypothetical protein
MKIDKKDLFLLGDGVNVLSVDVLDVATIVTKSQAVQPEERILRKQNRADLVNALFANDSIAESDLAPLCSYF